MEPFRYFSLLWSLYLFSSLVLKSTSVASESQGDRSIYIALVEGEPVAFRQGVESHKQDLESGLESHVAGIVAGNHGIPVIADGFNYGLASGMAPRARLAIYKALYPQGGTTADVIAAIDQAARDRVDIVVLSIGPNEAPKDTVTFMSVFDVLLLFARRAGVFVVQAAGNRGPGPSTVTSYSPWAMAVASSTTGRCYAPALVLGDGQRLRGVGLSGEPLIRTNA
ncbi:uncharacterized protein A4U43_C01F1710 [Asparagus officinalis]|uniref:Peptidase S8/S53 domain-containing protein n=1 Tax=Asparagus officinalis TaxID=4686 RepID=A0A5P1FNH2_ASPOF|nr:uncharacterized protein A4U43_C01F1710 [Asparagus officinalis]